MWENSWSEFSRELGCRFHSSSSVPKDGTATSQRETGSWRGRGEERCSLYVNNLPGQLCEEEIRFYFVKPLTLCFHSWAYPDKHIRVSRTTCDIGKSSCDFLYRMSNPIYADLNTHSHTWWRTYNPFRFGVSLFKYKMAISLSELSYIAYIEMEDKSI